MQGWKELEMSKEWVRQVEVGRSKAKQRRKELILLEGRNDRGGRPETKRSRSGVRGWSGNWLWEKLTSRTENRRESHRWLMETEYFSFRNCSFLKIFTCRWWEHNKTMWVVSQLNYWYHCRCGGLTGNSSSLGFHFPLMVCCAWGDRDAGAWKLQSLSL